MSKNSYKSVNERRENLLRFLASNQNSSLNEISSHFKTSEITTRRDISILSEEGLINKSVKGLYSLNCDPSFDPRYFLRYSRRHKEKSAIAQAAAELAGDCGCLFLAGGTTVLELSKHLSCSSPALIITNNLYIPMYLSQQPGNVQVDFLPGSVVFPGMSTAGTQALESIAGYNAEVVFFSADGLDIESGVTSDELQLNFVTHAMIRQARKRVLLIDSSKLGVTAIQKLADLSEVDVVVIDSNAEPSLLDALRERTEVVVAKL